MEQYEELAKQTLADILQKMHDKDYIGIRDVVDVNLMEPIERVEEALEETVFPDDIDTFAGKSYRFYKSAENCMTIESPLFSCTDELDYVIYVDIEKHEDGIQRVLRSIDVP